MNGAKQQGVAQGSYTNPTPTGQKIAIYVIIAIGLYFAWKYWK
jgi:predicted negative regulator of RcsB-dependent stress response